MRESIKNIAGTSILISSSFAYCGEVDQTKITTFVPGTVISSSAMNNAIHELVNQINNNAVRIAALESKIEVTPTDYSGIQSRLAGKYKGFVFGSDLNLSAQDLTASINHYSWIFSVSLTEGVGTYTMAASKSVKYELASVTESNTTNDCSITLAADNNGLVTGSGTCFVGKGFVNKRGDFISLIVTGNGSNDVSMMVLYKE